MKEYKSSLLSLGFTKINSNVYVKALDELVYTVSIEKQKAVDGIYIKLTVTHPDFLGGGAQQVDFMKSDKTPVGGWIGQMGVGTAPLVFSPERGSCFLKMTEQFFSYFHERSDMEVALRTLQGRRCYRGNVQLSKTKVSLPGISVQGRTETPIRPMYASHEFASKVEAVIEPFALQCKFDKVAELTYARKREGSSCFYDCFSVVFDDLGTFFYFRFYPWSDRFHDDDDRLSRFSELLEFRIPEEDCECWVFNTSDFLDGNFIKIADILMLGVDRVQSIHDEFDFVDKIPTHGNMVAQHLCQKFVTWSRSQKR